MDGSSYFLLLRYAGLVSLALTIELPIMLPEATSFSNRELVLLLVTTSPPIWLLMFPIPVFFEKALLELQLST